MALLVLLPVAVATAAEAAKQAAPGNSARRGGPRRARNRAEAERAPTVHGASLGSDGGGNGGSKESTQPKSEAPPASAPKAPASEEAAAEPAAPEEEATVVAPSTGGEAEPLSSSSPVGEEAAASPAVRGSRPEQAGSAVAERAGRGRVRQRGGRGPVPASPAPVLEPVASRQPADATSESGGVPPIVFVGLALIAVYAIVRGALLLRRRRLRRAYDAQVRRQNREWEMALRAAELERSSRRSEPDGITVKRSGAKPKRAPRKEPSKALRKEPSKPR